jgi:hypothetical protein
MVTASNVNNIGKHCFLYLVLFAKLLLKQILNSNFNSLVIMDCN